MRLRPTPRRKMAHVTTGSTSPSTASDSSEPRTSPVFDSLDVMKQILDFVDAPTVFGVRPTSSTFRAAGSAVPGRITLGTFESISASLHYRCHFELDDPDDYDSDASYGSTGPQGDWVTDECSMNGYYYSVYGHEDRELGEDDLKHLIVLVAPEISFRSCPWLDAQSTYAAPNGRWFTVGDLFDTIAKHEAETRYGPSNHVFFDGIEISKRGSASGEPCAKVFWGS